MQMRRQRTIRPALLRDPRLTTVPMGTRFFAIALLAWADDQGRGEVLPRRMRREMLPDDETVTPERIEDAMLALDESGFLALYTDEDGRTLFQIVPDLVGPVDRRNPSTYPSPPSGTPFANAFANRGLGERAGERVRFESASESEAVRLPPTPFCSKHIAGTSRNCRPCGQARLRHDQWVRLENAGMDNSHLTEGEHEHDEFDDTGWAEPVF